MKQSTINYYDAVQCKDKITGKIGDFLHNGDFVQSHQYLIT